MIRSDEVLSLAIATAKAGGNALLIDQDNQPQGWVSLSEAVESGQAFAVEPKAGLVALDLDTPELVSEGRKVKAWADNTLGASTVLCASGRPGHQHLWVRLPEDITAEFFTELLKENYPGISGDAVRSKSATRPPLSSHRSGLPVSLIEPESVSEALQRLGPPENTSQGEKEPQGLSEKWRRVLKYGDAEGRYRTPNGETARGRMGMALAGAYVRSGLSLDMFIDDMLNPGNLGGAKPQEIRDTKGQASAYKWLRDTWATAEENALAELDPNHVENSLNKFMGHVEAWPWKGRTGSTDRDVLRSITRLGIRHNTLEPLASLRDLQLEAGKSLETTRKSVNRLKADKWVFQGSPKGGAKARVYKLNPEKCSETSTDSIHGGTVNKSVLVNEHILKHPVFTSRKALQGRPAEIWSRLPREWVSSRQAAELTGYKTSGVRNALKRLVSFELAEVDQGTGPKGGDLYRCKDVSAEHLDKLAKETGALEDLESKRQRVERERDAWNNRH